MTTYLPEATAQLPSAAGARRVVRYRVRRKDLASRIYRCLGCSRWKPHVIATARLLWLCELAAMPAMPGVSLGVKQVVEHLAPAVRGTVVTVTAECVNQHGRYWEWDIVVRDEYEVLALCTLGFVAEIDAKDYTARRIAPKLAARSIKLIWWLHILDTLVLTLLIASPLELLYAAHSETSLLTVEVTLIVGWAIALTGLPFAIIDCLTIRRSPRLPSPRHTKIGNPKRRST